MKSRTITVTVLAAIAVIAVWWMFVFSPTRSDASKASDDVAAAKEQQRTLETQKKQIEDLEKHAPEIKADLDRLHKAVPEDAALAAFIDQANAIARESGVKWSSVAPAQPTATVGASSGSVNLTIGVEGDYFQTLDYINRLESIPRLLVVDQISVTTSTGADGRLSLTTTMNARMFMQGAAPTTTPDAATTAAGGTTPTSVAGGGGVAAPDGTQNS